MEGFDFPIFFFGGGGGAHLSVLRAYSLLCTRVTPGSLGDHVECWGLSPLDCCSGPLHFSTVSSQHLLLFIIFYYNHYGGCEVLSHCGFDLHLIMIPDNEFLFITLLYQEKWLFKSSVLFSLGLYLLFLVELLKFFYICVCIHIYVCIFMYGLEW